MVRKLSQRHFVSVLDKINHNQFNYLLGLAIPEDAGAHNDEEAGAAEVDYKTSRFTEGPSDDRPREKSRKVIQRRRTSIGLREEVKCEYTLTCFEAIIGR